MTRRNKAGLLRDYRATTLKPAKETAVHMIPENLDFLQWMTQVDADLEASLGINSRDLSDAPYRDYFEDGLTAAEAAEEVVLANIEYDDDPLENVYAS